MSSSDPSAPGRVDQAVIKAAQCAQQLQTHRANLPWAVGGSALAALFLTGMQWGTVATTLLLGWLSLLAVLLGLRLVTRMQDPQAALDAAASAVWLRRYRAGFLGHGLVWALASAMPLPAGESLHLAVLIVVLASVTAINFTLTSYDLVAALLFGVPVLGALGVRLVSQGDATSDALGIAAFATLGFMGLSARRANRFVRHYVALRVAEAAQGEALRHSEELLARTGATAGVGGWELDLATMALRLTAQAYLIHDAPPTSRPSFDGFLSLYALEQQAEMRAGLAAVVASATPYDQAHPLTTVRGRQRWVRMIGRPQLEDGKVVRISGVVQDITEAKAAERALAEKHHLLTLLVQTTREGFWFIDVEGITTDVNPAMCEILGRRREDIIGKGLYDFVDATNAAIFREQVKQRLAGVASGYEIALSRPDGSQVDCFNNATPIFDTAGRRVGAIGMFADISARKRTETQLLATSAELTQKTHALQVTLDSIAQGIVSMDADGRISVHNRRMLELLDLPEALFRPGATLTEIAVFQNERGDFGEGLSYFSAESRHFIRAMKHLELPPLYVRETRSGRRIEVQTHHLPDGSLVRTFADVTAYFEAQQALHDSEAQLRALLDAFPGYIAVQDAACIYTYANERVAALLGRTREQVVGHSSREVLGDERFAQVQAVVARAAGGDPVTVEMEYPATARRRHAWLQVTHAVNADTATGRRDHYAFGIDISARKAAELALTEARDEAERANRAKSEFLSRMSHELRTPMNAILGFGQLLVSDVKHPLAEQQREHVGEILRGARHLLSLINEVLDLALVETGKLQVSLEPVQLAELLQECMGLVHPLARADGIDLKLPDEAACACFVSADRTRLKQVLLNLLSNAIKYNRPRGHVHIACSAEADTVRIDISDNGPGLSAPQASRLFQAFERLDAVRTDVEGAGLGLALSKHLMDAMGGVIGLESEVGVGSTFWLRLPRAQAPKVPGRGEPAVPLLRGDSLPPARLRKVLYIEDNPVNVLLMEAMLGRLPGLQMLSAPLPMLGLQMVVDERPELILLDIQLPGMDSFEVLRRLRLHEAGRHVPVIAVSANAMAHDVEHGLAAGFMRYLTKPLDMQELLAAVEAALATPQ
ncbi:MAG: PAS domain S-box protein [Burkholderiales bacterium]|nr:PAS domain S-box protein [Burkholderiales bacterium]